MTQNQTLKTMKSNHLTAYMVNFLEIASFKRSLYHCLVIHIHDESQTSHFSHPLRRGSLISDSACKAPTARRWTEEISRKLLTAAVIVQRFFYSGLRPLAVLFDGPVNHEAGWSGRSCDLCEELILTVVECSV